MVGKWMEDTSSAIGSLVQKMTPPAPASASGPSTENETRKNLYKALSEIPGLSIDDRVLATHKLADNEKYMEAFWEMCGEARERYVHLLLK